MTWAELLVDSVFASIVAAALGAASVWVKMRADVVRARAGQAAAEAAAAPGIQAALAEHTRVLFEAQERMLSEARRENAALVERVAQLETKIDTMSAEVDRLSALLEAHNIDPRPSRPRRAGRLAPETTE